MVAQNAEKVNIATATLTEPFIGTTTYAVDLVNIPDTTLDTEIYAWAYVNLAGGVQIVLPVATQGRYRKRSDPAGIRRLST